MPDDCTATEGASGVTSPGVYLRDDPVCGTQLENQSELRAPTAERAAYFLDAAIAARASPGQATQSIYFESICQLKEFIFTN